MYNLFKDSLGFWIPRCGFQILGIVLREIGIKFLLVIAMLCKAKLDEY